MKRWLNLTLVVTMVFTFLIPVPILAADTDSKLLSIDFSEQDARPNELDVRPVYVEEKSYSAETLLAGQIVPFEDLEGEDLPIQILASPNTNVGGGVTSSVSTFNNITSPSSVNQSTAPKYAGLNSQEDISPYSGELTMKMNDISLPGRNGLDLNIGRVYQTNQSEFGDRRMQVFLANTGVPEYSIVMNDTNYWKNRYNLGLGWAFNFPSVQIEKEYEGVANSSTYSYTETQQLYYHTGNGAAYQVDFSSGNYSNLKDYYAQDIKFNQNDTGYSNGQVTSYYSLTHADQTKEYFASDGRLIGIKDRFGNIIKFEHTMKQTSMGVPNGHFEEYGALWTRSNTSAVRYAAAPSGNYGDSLRFYTSGDHFATSNLILVEPSSTYTLSADFWHNVASSDAKIEILMYDTDVVQRASMPSFFVEGLTPNNWTNKTYTITTTSATRYVRVRLISNYETNFYTDNVAFYKPQPIISKITDTIGRTVTFDYSAEPKHKDDYGQITLTVKSPDNSQTKTITYTQDVATINYNFNSQTDDFWEKRYIRLIGSSHVDGSDEAPAHYWYDGGKLNGSNDYEILAWDAESKTATKKWSSYSHKLALNRLRYKNREIVYTYEKVAKHLGSGFYETLRVKQRHERFGYLPSTSNDLTFQGEESKITYSYSGTYSGNTFNNETGYPSYNFSNKTTLNETYQCTQTEHFDTTTTNRLQTITTFSNAKLQQTEKKNLKTNEFQRSEILSRHSTFKDSPTAIKNTVGTTSQNNVTYVDTTYNSWGGVATQTRAIPDTIRNNPTLKEKYTIGYAYDPTYRFKTEKTWYDSENGAQLSELSPYDPQGRLISTTNAAKETTNYFYENPSYPGNVTKTVQDDPENMHKTISKQQKVVTLAYDLYNAYIASQTETARGVAATTEYTYEYIWGQPKRVTNPDGGYTEYVYAPQSGWLKAVYSPYVQAAGGRFRYYEQYNYDGLKAPIGYKNNIDYVFDSITYYKCINVEGSASASIIGRTDYYYDRLGNEAFSAQTDYSRPSGYIFNWYYYDIAGRLESVKNNDNSIYQYAYDPFGRRTQITDPRNSKYVTEYNDGLRTKLSYFVPVSASTTKENHILEEYDIYGNMTTRRGYPAGYTTSPTATTLTESYQYDIAGRVTAITDPKNHTTNYKYDNVGRLEKVKYPNNESSGSNYNKFNKPNFEHQYNVGGAEVSMRGSVVDERGNVFMRFYTESNMLRQIDTYSYNDMGLLENETVGGKTFSYLYDQSGNVTSASAATGGSVDYRYHYFGVQTKTPNSTAVSVLTYGYDGMGRLQTQKQDSFANTTYTYKPIGTVDTITNPFNMQTGHTYDANLRLQNVSADGKTYIHDYYDDGTIKSITYPSVAGQALKTSYVYDNLNRITNITTTKGATAVSTLVYGYDANSNITSETRNGNTTNYTYDELNRLKTAQYPNISGITEYFYDAKGNREKEINGANTKIYAYDGDNRLQSVKLNGIITEEYEYNSMGAITKRNGETFSYDEWNRMSGHANGGSSDTFKYDSDGLRTKKNDTQYIADASGRVIAEANAGGAVTAQMVYGMTPLARKEGSNWYYYITNAHGDVIDVLDATSGNSVKSYTFDAWGNIIGETGSFNQPIRYAGEYYDSELDMYYLRSRYYDPQVGRFTSNDPIEPGIAQAYAMNRYIYCLNNPVMYVDRNGEFAVTTLVICIIGGAVIGALVSGGTNAVTQGMTKGWDNINSGEVWISAGGGALSGGLAASGVGLGWVIAGNAIISAGTYAGTQAVNGKDITVGGLAANAGAGALFGAIGGSSSGTIKELTKTQMTFQLAKSLGIQSGQEINRQAFREILFKAGGAAFLQGIRDEVIQNIGFSVLKVGATGSQVEQLQALLGVKQDGDFGPQTEEALMELQRKLGVDADGKYGPQTRGALSALFYRN